MFTVESKSQLAKLMATENLTIEHRKIKTAMIDVKNRILFLPIWKEMSGFMYDHLAGHEVGHALYTPPEGAHSAIIDNKTKPGWKSFLNVIEDARIEKKIQRRYPGLRRSFISGYRSLCDRDFFGVANKDINSITFINRINIFTKSQYTENIRFTDEELVIIERVKNLETFEQVLALTDELYERAKDDQREQEKNDPDFANGDDDGFSENSESPDFEDQFSDEEQDDQESEDSSESEKSEDNKKEKSEDSDDSDGDESTEDAEENLDSQNGEKESAESEDLDPSCETDENFRRNESSLLDESCREYVYLTLPTPNLETIVTPAKRVQELMTDFYSDPQLCYLTKEKIQQYVSDFKNRNDRYVSLLAKEFEMRKAAKVYSKAKISDTGDIDVNKLSNYRFDDNIFRKVMSMPKGKSHGLMLLLDYSGSMSNNMAGSIEQILVLTMFCRKVNIPFAVFAFSNCTYTKSLDFPGKSINAANCFSKNVGELSLHNFSLREYMNSDMSNSEYNNALKNMVLLRESYMSRRMSHVSRPSSERLSNTPLNEAIIAMAPIAREFKTRRKLDMTSLIIVHDGDADSTNCRVTSGEERTYSGWFDIQKENIILSDNKFKFQKKMWLDNHLTSGEKMTASLFEWFTHVTGSKIIGFFIVPPGRNLWSSVNQRFITPEKKSLYQSHRELVTGWDYSAYKEAVAEQAKKLRTEGFLLSHNIGYDSFFLVLGGKELISEDDLEIEGKVTASKLKTAFMKLNKKRQVSRVLVNKFIQKVAAA